MPWGSNFLNGRGGGNFRQPQADPHAAQRYGKNILPLFGSNRSQQAVSDSTQQAGSYMPGQRRPMREARQTQRQTQPTRPQTQQPAQQTQRQQARPIQQMRQRQQAQPIRQMQQRQQAQPIRQMQQQRQQAQQIQQRAQQQIRQMQQQSQSQPMQLEDGVQLQPINASAMGMLQGLGAKLPAQQTAVQSTAPVQTMASTQPTAPVQPAALTQPALTAQQAAPLQLAAPVQRVQADEQKQSEHTDDMIGDSLRELIQDEYNSSRFYAFMAGQAPRGAYADYFKQESNKCGERANKLSGLCATLGGNAFSPLDTEINIQVNFNEGVSWAVAVESHALEKFGALYGNAPDERSARTIFSHVCGKISHIMMLILIMQNKDVTV